MDLVKQIDAKKRKIEIIHANRVKSELDNIAAIAGKMYSINGSINASEIVENSRPEIITAIRKIYKATQTAFNSDLRDRFTGKKQQQIVISKEQNQKIQEYIDTENMIFINNQSETQTDLILETTENQINDKVATVTILIMSQISYSRQRITELNSEIAQIDSDINIALDNIDELKRKKKELQKELSKVTNELNRLTTNTNSVIGKEITDQLKDLNVARSQLIAEQEVGIAESQTRYTEAQALNRSDVVTTTGISIAGKIKKIWSAILDGKTRESHAKADGQTVGLNEDFIVGGSVLRYPRDPLAPIRETARCRCVVIYDFGGEGSNIHFAI